MKAYYGDSSYCMNAQERGAGVGEPLMGVIRRVRVRVCVVCVGASIVVLLALFASSAVS